MAGNCGTLPPANAILTFEQPGTEFVTDPATCNKVLEPIEVQVKAVLTELNFRGGQTEQAGLDRLGRQMRGYLYETPPGDHPFHGRVQAEIGGESGTFHFAERITPYRDTIISHIGIPIRGTFQTEGGAR